MAMGLTVGQSALVYSTAGMCSSTRVTHHTLLACRVADLAPPESVHQPTGALALLNQPTGGNLPLWT